MTGELKDIWSAVQNFREKEKSGVSDIVVYTEFGPDSATPISPIQKCTEESIESIINNEVNSNEVNVQEKAAEALTDKSIDSTAALTNIVESPNTTSLESENFAIEKLSLSDKKSKNNNSNINNENESSEKIVKVQNQKNKESQHHFFPKFLTSSKVKDDTAKDKEKDKDKEKHDEQETKVKSKKSLNFFRRNKSSTGSPTHNNNSDNSNNANNNITAD